MNKLTTKLLGLSTVLLLLMGLTVGTASAQEFFAEKDGVGAAPCVVADPCDLDDAVEAATTLGPPATVFVRLPTSSTTTTFELDLDGTAALLDDIAISTYRSVGGVVTEGGPGGTPLDGIIDVEGDIVIESMVTLTIAEGVTLRLSGQVATLEMNNNAVIDGEGTIEFGDTLAHTPRVSSTN